MRDEIAAYLAAGWALCKIKPRSKGAFEEGWSTREGAHVGQDALPTWDGGVGLLHAYSGTCAIDVDNMKLACESFAVHGIDLAACFRAADACVWWRGDPTRMKLLYALPEPLVSVQRGQHGFEFRCMSQSGTSMQDVLPPSIHESGVPYSWLKGDWRQLPPLPPELRKIWPRLKALFPETLGASVVKPAKAAGSSLTAAAMVGPALSAGEGERNAWLSSQLFAYLKRGGDYEAGRAWLHALNEERCEPPEDVEKVDKIWRSKGHIEPDPLVVAGPAGAPDLVFDVKPELPHGYSWDGDWIYHLEGKDLKKLITQPLWVERIVRSRTLDGRESRRLEVMTRDGAHLITTEHLLTKVEVTLANIGINVIEEDAKRVRRYLVRCKELCEQKGKIVDSYNTLGWQADNSFLVGARLYRAGAPYTRVALSEGLQAIAHGMEPAPQGSLAAWRSAAMEIMQPNNMSQAFGLLMGMAAPLMKLSGERGGIYSLLGESGQGKSTVQNAISTVWGAPEAFRTVAQDTTNARMIKLAMLSNLPLMGEELTKMEPVELRNLAYAISEGRDKDRATQDGTLRENVGTWHTLMVSSSNRSLLDALLLADSDAAAFRLLEDTVTLPKGATQAAGERIMRGLVANQGHAGFVFAQYLVDHREHIAKLIERTSAKLAVRVVGSTKERIRVNMLACALVAGAVLNATGILTFNVSTFADYGIDLLKRNMGMQDAGSVTFADVLQGFIDANQPGVLRMKNNQPLNVVSIQGRAAALVMRYDVGLEELTINRTVLHRWVQDKGQNWASFREWLHMQGYLKREQRVQLSAGSGLPASPQVWCMTLDNLALGGIAAAAPRSDLTTAAIA